MRRLIELTALVALSSALSSAWAATAHQKVWQASRVTIDAGGAVHMPAMVVPFSPLVSAEGKRNYLDFVHGFEVITKGGEPTDDIHAIRKRLDDRLMRPGVQKLRAVFAVNIKSERIGGVKTDVIEPATGVAGRNRRRVLIELHGGGFSVGAGLGGQMESIPIASLGAIRVVAVDYREAPEYKFPAASVDVAAVYRELLKRYPARNIGIYGCSAGGILTAESVAWFQKHGLPKPGAIGIFGAGALIPLPGDSNYVGSALMGTPPTPEDAKMFMPYFDVPSLDIRDPMVSPAYSPSVLAGFPPSLLISGTRDVALSSAAYTQAKMTDQGVAVDLHVWEGATHCMFAQPVVDPASPETRETWDVIVKFFDRHLGS